MGTFAETANVDNRLWFADQGKQTTVFYFRLQQTHESLSFPFSVRSLPFSVSSVSVYSNKVYYFKVYT
jgi:hypothetical protein